MNPNTNYIPVDKSGNDLVTMRPAANILKMSANCFCKQARRRDIPPPILFSGKSRVRYWSREQLAKFRKCEIQKNEDGVWYERDVVTKKWSMLPNQYFNNLPETPCELLPLVRQEGQR